MIRRLFGDISTDDTGTAFEVGAVIALVAFIALTLCQFYDLWAAWRAYDLLLGQMVQLHLAAPPAPKFDATSYGMGTGAIMGGKAAHSWATTPPAPASDDPAPGQ